MTLALNLLFNSMASFWAGALWVALVLAVFQPERHGEGGWRLRSLVLAIPALRLAWDLARGVPAGSIAWTGLDPLSFPPNHQTLTLGAGAGYFGPFFNVLLSTRPPVVPGVFQSSVGDYVSVWILAHGGRATGAALLGSAIVVAGIRLAARARAASRLAREWRSGNSEERLVLAAGRRSISVWVTDRFSGSPFVFGLLRPRVVFPADLHARLSPAERAAALAHERAHVVAGDPWMAALSALTGDVFWFVPGMGRYLRVWEAARERAADRAALASGVQPAVLASTLLGAGELLRAGPAAPGLAFARASTLRTRVEALWAAPAPVTGIWIWGARVALLWFLGGAFQSTLGGNAVL